MSEYQIRIVEETVQVDIIDQEFVVEPFGGEGPQGINGPVGTSSGLSALFTTAEGMEIEAGVTGIRMVGYASKGDGGEGYFVKVTLEPSHPAKFQDADGNWWGLAPGQTFRGEHFGAVGDGVTDDSPAFQAALSADIVDRVVGMEKDYGHGTLLNIPSGKTLDGAGPGRTNFKLLPSLSLGTVTNNAFTCDPDAKTVQMRNFSVDAQYVGHTIGGGGGGTLDRVHVIVARGFGFLVENVGVKNAWGYALWGVGDASHKAWGTFRHCTSENCDTLQETGHTDAVRGVTFDDCHSTSGAGDIPCENGMVAHGGSLLSIWRNSSFKGVTSVGFGVIANNGDQRIIVDNVRVIVEANSPAFVASTDVTLSVNDVTITGGSHFENAIGASPCAIIEQGSMMDASGDSRFIGGGVGILSQTGARVRGTGAHVTGRHDDPEIYAYGLYAIDGGTIVWSGAGSIQLESTLGLAVTGAGITIGEQVTVDPPLAGGGYDAGIAVTPDDRTNSLVTAMGPLGWWHGEKVSGAGGTADSDIVSDADLDGGFLATIIPRVVTGPMVFGFSDAPDADTAYTGIKAGFLLDAGVLQAMQAGAGSPHLGIYTVGEALHIRRPFGSDTITLYQGGATYLEAHKLLSFDLLDGSDPMTLGFDSALWNVDDAFDVRIAELA